MPSNSLIRPFRLGLAEKLKNPAFRSRFFRRNAQDEIAMQIRAMRERRGYTRQADFAKHAKMQQSAVSRIEHAEYAGWTFRTLLRVADALDARLKVVFEPVEDVIARQEASDRKRVFKTTSQDADDTECCLIGKVEEGTQVEATEATEGSVAFWPPPPAGSTGIHLISGH